MKKGFFMLLSLAGISFLTTAQSFTLKGEMAGLQTGDSLFITLLSLPGWEEVKVDTFFSSQPGQFSYEAPLAHTSLFLLTHKPKDLPPITSCFRGATFVIKPGDKLSVTGDINYIGALEVRGGFYNDPLIIEMDSLENIYNRGLNDIYLKAIAAQEKNEPDSIKKYSDMYSAYRGPEGIGQRRQYYSEEVQNSEYAAYMYLNKLSDVTYEQLEERLEKFDPAVLESDMGKKLVQMRRIMKNIQVGDNPPGFTVTDREGNRLNLSDYKDKYVLIYHWGICPGTLWVQPRLLKLYEEFHGKGFEIVGFTVEDLDKTYPELREEEEFTALFDHPWQTVITEEPENRFIKDEYYFSGVPILMLISPEGKTLFRGYTEVFDLIKETLTTNLTN